MAKRAPCPICGKSAHEPFLPFCSKRCSDIDLGKWITGDYAVPVVEEEPDDLIDSEDD